jgi:hypothetical protein
MQNNAVIQRKFQDYNWHIQLIHLTVSSLDANKRSMTVIRLTLDERAS